MYTMNNLAFVELLNSTLLCVPVAAVAFPHVTRTLKKCGSEATYDKTIGFDIRRVEDAYKSQFGFPRSSILELPLLRRGSGRTYPHVESLKKPIYRAEALTQTQNGLLRTLEE
jgi:hypothetical protein